MKIEIINKEGNELTSFELESNPFKVGEILHINIVNRDPNFWNREEQIKKLKILKIEHFSRQVYSTSKKYYSYFAVSINVEELDLY